MKKLVSIFIMLFSFTTLFAKEFESQKKAESFVAGIVEDFTEKKFQESVDRLKEYSFINSATMDNLVVQASQQWTLIEQVYGKKLSVDFLSSKKAGESLVQLVHIVRFENYPLIFRTVLYRAEKGWTVVGFSFNDTLTDLF